MKAYLIPQPGKADSYGRMTGSCDRHPLPCRSSTTAPQRFLALIKPYREDVAVAVECMFCWYWLADLCADEGIPFILRHALYMKVIHGGKAKNDKIDSEKIALLLKSGMFPESYAYPKEMPATRDLLRRRLFFTRKRSELYSHVVMTYQQYNEDAPTTSIQYKRNRIAVWCEYSYSQPLI